MVTAEQLAREACEIEIGICGKSIGKQDQYIAVYGGICQFTFRKDDTVDVKQFRRSPELFHGLSRNIMLFYSGRTRKAENILSVQDQRTDVNLEQLHCLKALALRTAEALDRLRLWEVGRMMNDGWQLKRQLAENISSPEIEEMMEAYRELPIAFRFGRQQGHFSKPHRIPHGECLAGTLIKEERCHALSCGHNDRIDNRRADDRGRIPALLGRTPGPEER